MYKILSRHDRLRSNYFLFTRNLSGLNLWNEELSADIKHKIEDYWSPHIKSKGFDVTDKDKQKYYVLSMFPYPSGHLHMGHVRVYTISDTIARFQRMNGKNVIHPIGWDAFGLPAENAAIDRKVSPDTWTYENINHMKQQLVQLGCSFEWDRELTTCDPKYYKWTQDLFLKLYNSGLVYQKEALVNWDPVDKTVLADEQVDENGCSWRSGAKVEKKLLNQWFIRTTRFAKDLLDGLSDETLEDWRDVIKLQRHWIGECNGISVGFTLTYDGGKEFKDFMTMWTNTPEYLDQCKFIAVNNENVLARKENIKVANNTEKLKVCARNPLNNETIPIYVTDQIEFLDDTDSYLGLPVSNESDAVFANRMNISFELKPLQEEEAQRKSTEAIDKLKRLNLGGYFTSAKLRDWLISRQRYWGTPIPIIHCSDCGPQPVPQNELPVELPKLESNVERGTSYLKECTDWLNVSCPKCKKAARRETDTMDTFVDSTWYFLRYLDRNNDKEMFDVDKIKKYTPVDLYIGGKEHAVLHLYYARFISHFLYSLGLLPEREPFKRLLVQGMVMGKSYRIKGTGEYLPEKQIKLIDKSKNKAVDVESGNPVVISWEKMSKSKHNGVDPSDMFQQYGIDTTRLLILADVSPTSHRNWNSNTFPGVLNWQRRLWLTINDFIKHRSNLPKMIDENDFKQQEDFMFDSRNFYVKGATFNYCLSQQISVAISKMQGLTNSIRRAPPAVFAHGLQFERALATQIIVLAPIAPHFASELWSGFLSAPNRLNDTPEIMWDKLVLEQKWPEIDLDYNLDLVCLVNGQESAIVKMPKRDLELLTYEKATEIALSQKEIQEVLSEKKSVIKILYNIYKGYDGVVNIIASSNIKTDPTTL